MPVEEFGPAMRSERGRTMKTADENHAREVVELTARRVEAAKMRFGSAALRGN